MRRLAAVLFLTLGLTGCEHFDGEEVTSGLATGLAGFLGGAAVTYQEPEDAGGMVAVDWPDAGGVECASISGRLYCAQAAEQP